MSRLKQLKKLDQEIFLDLSSKDNHGVELKIDDHYYAIYEEQVLHVYSKKTTKKPYKTIRLHKRATHVFCQHVVDKETNKKQLQILKDGPEFIFLTFIYKRMKFRPTFFKSISNVRRARKLPDRISPDWYYDISGIDGKLYSATFYEKERINEKGEPELYLSLEAYSYNYSTNLTLFRTEIEQFINAFAKKQRAIKIAKKQKKSNKNKKVIKSNNKVKIAA